VDRILLVEDDVELAAMICEYLTPEGFAVDAVHDGAAPAALRPANYDLVVLDVMLPDRSGFEVLKALRQSSNIPVILLTARDSETDRVVGLELGADDYVPKPFRPRELVARIRAVLRRTRLPARGAIVEPLELQVGDVRLNQAARFAARGGRKLDLTSAEFDLLQQFLQCAGTPVSRDTLAQAALGRVNGFGTERNVDTLVSKLRRKLGSDDLIKTVRNTHHLSDESRDRFRYILLAEPSVAAAAARYTATGAVASVHRGGLLRPGQLSSGALPGAAVTQPARCGGRVRRGARRSRRSAATRWRSWCGRSTAWRTTSPRSFRPSSGSSWMCRTRSNRRSRA
jgi:DNA-binding response OmpR family regulator